ncbi:MAG: hypothetical protein K2P99_03715 [Burkholderiales bacterium]|nr:hypothetical protein [Burkholderiales bacterium]
MQKRVAILENWGRVQPELSDFENQKTNLMFSRSFILYALTENNSVQFVFFDDLERTTNRYGYKIGIKDIFLKMINDIPQDIWEKIVEDLRLHKKRPNK